MSYRHATDEEFAELRALARQYEQTAGRQGYLYTSQPQNREHFHFGDGTKVTGIAAALDYQRSLNASAPAHA